MHTYTMDDDPCTYLELKPRRVNLIRVFRVLSSADIEDFVESSGKEASFEGRWMVFLSAFIQKLLQYNEKPLSLLGSTSELCLNIFGNATNFKIFFINLFRGKVEVPRSNYLSIIGLLDTRVDLDNNIEPGSSKYFPTLCAMASKLAYENEEFIKLTVQNTWKMELLGTYNFWDERYKGNTTQAFMFRDNNTNPGTIVVAFRGTEPFNADDWITDFDISWCKLKGMEGKVHGGFLKALGLNQARIWPLNVRPGAGPNAYNTITQDLTSYFDINIRTRFIVTGHSLGGALALLFSAVLIMHDEIELLEKLEAIYTFGQPKVGDERFGKFMEEKFRVYGVRYLRFVYSNDVVPTLPIDNSALMFKHFGTCLYFNTLYEAKIVEEEKVKNYFERGSSIVSNRVDVIWELVRSFLLPNMFGPDYKEGLLLRMFRLIGLLCPGLTAHGLQDYINATRLATY